MARLAFFYWGEHIRHFPHGTPFWAALLEAVPIAFVMTAVLWLPAVWIATKVLGPDAPTTTSKGEDAEAASGSPEADNAGGVGRG